MGQDGEAELPAGFGEFLGSQRAVLGFPIVEEPGQRLGPQLGGGRLSQPGRQGMPAVWAARRTEAPSWASNETLILSTVMRRP
jgi:hypothetical protein